MIGLRLVAVRVALVGFAATCVGHAVLVAAENSFDSGSQLVVALAAGAVLWCGWWALTLKTQPGLAQMLGIVVVLAGLMVGQGFAAGDDGLPIVIGAVAVAATTLAVSRIGRDRAELRDRIDDAAVEVAGARAAAATAGEADTARLAEFDQLVHGLSSIELQARVAARDSTGSSREALQSIERTAAGHLSDVRKHEEPPSTSTTTATATNSTTAALGKVVERFVRNVDVHGQLEVRGEPQKVPATVELALIRTLQEAISNIRRHARATSFTAEVIFGEHAVELTVDDNGIGYDPDTARDDGGLATARRRLEVLGGSLTVTTSDGAGTNLVASVPMTPPGT